MSAISLTRLPLADACLQWCDELPAVHSSDGSALGVHQQVRPGELLTEFPDIARYRVTSGTTIEVALLPGGTHAEAEFFLMGTPWGALLHQRGELPLHASAVVPPGGDHALLLAGHSGAGKSTTAALLVAAGWSVLCDDVSRIADAEGGLHVWPGFAALKLWQNSCTLLQLDSAHLPPTRGRRKKFFLHAPTYGKSLPIAAVVELNPEQDESAAQLVRQRGGDAMQLILRQTFRPRLIQPLGCQFSHFQRMQQTVAAVPCYRFDNCRALAPADLVLRLQTLLA